MANKKETNLASSQANRLIAELPERRENKNTSSVSKRNIRISKTSTRFLND